MPPPTQQKYPTLQAQQIWRCVEAVGYELEQEKARIESAAEGEPTPEEGSPEIYGSDIKKIKEQRIKELAQLLNPKK